MRKGGSALLLAFVGFFSLGITGGMMTFFVYGLGAGPGALGGAVLGLLYGWRLALRDAIIWFVCYFALLAIVCRHLAQLVGPAPQNWQQLLSWAFVIGPCGPFICRIPLSLLSFEHRRILAAALATLWTLALGALFYWWLYIWNP